MALQGPFLPASGIDDGGLNPWTTPSAITADDGSNATISMSTSGPTNWLIGTQCGFTIPSDAFIDGIEIALNDYSSEGDDSGLHATKNGSSTSPAGVVPTPGAGWQTYGSPTYLWGTSWTPAEVNATTFGAMFRALNSVATWTASLDAMRITVYYSFGFTTRTGAVVYVGP